MSNVIIIAVLSCVVAALIIGIVAYCFRKNIRSFFRRTFRRKKRVHEIPAPVRPSESDIVLAVTQIREPSGSLRLPPTPHPPPCHGTTLGRHNTVVGDGTYQRHIQRPLPPHLAGRHQSFSLYGGARRAGSDLQSPFVSNMSSLQSLLMSSQVAVFNSSTERLSLSSQINNPHVTHQPISLPLLRHQQQLHRHVLTGTAVSPLASPATSSLHLPQPSYFEERPPSYQDSILIQKLRASDRAVGRRTGNITGIARSSTFR